MSDFSATRSYRLASSAKESDDENKRGLRLRPSERGRESLGSLIRALDGHAHDRMAIFSGPPFVRVVGSRGGEERRKGLQVLSPG